VTLRQKLVVGLGVNILIVASIVASSILITGGMTGSLETIRDEAFPQALASLEIENSINLIVLGIEASTESGTQTFIDEAERVQGELNKQIEDLKVLMEGRSSTVASMETLNEEVQKLFKIGEDLYLASLYMEYDRIPVLGKQFGNLKEELLRQVTLLKNDSLLKLEGAIADISERSSGTSRLTFILGVIAIALGILGMIILSLSIMKPMNSLVTLMKKAEHGDFTVRYANDKLIKCWEKFKCEKTDCPAYGMDDLRCWQVTGTHCEHGIEHGAVAKEQACEACKVYQSAAGDEFSAIGEAFNNMMAGLVNLLQLVSRASTEVMNASKNLLNLSEDLRHGSDQQSRSVDEVTASIEEMNTTIKNVAENVDDYYSSAEESNTSLLEMTASIEEVANSAETLTSIVEKTSGLLDELTVSIREVATHSGGLSEQVDQSSSALIEINTSVGEVAESARESSHMASFVTEKLQLKGETAVKRTSEAIQEVREIVTDAANVIRDLGDRSSNIGSILQVIDEVSDQTRLLSLNAAILAAQSGAQGKAFSVVAEEIRALSDQTSSSTQEITQLLSSIPVEVEKVTRAISKGTEKVDEGVTLIGEVQEAIAEVADAAQRSAEASDLIMNATSEQASGIMQASQLEQNISVMSKEIAEATRYQADSCERIMESAEQMKSLALQVKRATDEQVSGTKLISLASSESMKMAKSITDATKEEAYGSELIVKSIGAVTEATSRNMEVFAQLGEMVASLSEHSQLLQEEMARFKVEERTSVIRDP
jgi:methyl-accepting chemotaxis protein